MRKVKLQMQLSLDGLVAGPDGEMDWMTLNWDKQLEEFVKNVHRKYSERKKFRSTMSYRFLSRNI